jgi:hypothetical protein
MLTEEDADISSAPFAVGNGQLPAEPSTEGRAAHGLLVLPHDGVDAGRIHRGHHLPTMLLVCRFGLSRFRQRFPLRHSFIDRNR